MMLANFIIGGGASSRLFLRLREELGLAYSIYSGSYADTGAGLFTVSASVAPEEQELVLTEIRGVLDGLLDGVTEPEFQRAKAQVKEMCIRDSSRLSSRSRTARSSTFSPANASVRREIFTLANTSASVSDRILYSTPLSSSTRARACLLYTSSKFSRTPQPPARP